MHCKKKHQALKDVQKAVEAKAKAVEAKAHEYGSRAFDMSDKAGDALHAGQAGVHGALHAGHEKFDELRHGAGDALVGAGEFLHGAAGLLSDVAHGAVARAGDWRSKAEHLREQGTHQAEAAREAALKVARKAKKEREAQAHQAMEDAKRHLKKKKEEFAVRHFPEIVVEKKSNDKWLWMIVGLGIGVLAGIMLAPATGRRTRALLRDKVVKGGHQAQDLGETVAKRAQDLKNRADGAAHEFKAKHSDNGIDLADNVTLADRVRSELGHLEFHFGLERINVDAYEGTVTLRGPMPNKAVAEQVVATAMKVHGVTHVKDEMAIDDDGPAFVG